MLERQILLYLYKGYPYSVVMTFFLGLLEVTVVSNEINRQRALGWLAALSLILFLRVLDYLYYLVIHKSEVYSVSRMFRHFRLGLLLTGLVWGSFPVLMAGSLDLSQMVFIAFVFAGITSGATTSIGVDRLSMIIYLVTTLLPMFIYYMSFGERMTAVMGVMIFFFAIFLFASSTRLRSQLIHNVELREEAQEKEAVLEKRQKMTEMIVHLQAARLDSTIDGDAFDRVLQEMMQLTGSGYGFIAGIEPDSSGTQGTRILANAGSIDLGFTRELLQNGLPMAGRLNRLIDVFQRTLVSGKPQFTPDIEFFVGTPRVLQYASMLSLPVLAGNRVVAVIGLFNQNGTLDGHTAEFLSPLLRTLGFLFASGRDGSPSGPVSNAPAAAHD
jgi:hypothetical protein